MMMMNMLHVLAFCETKIRHRHKNITEISIISKVLYIKRFLLFGDVAKLRKATVSFVMSVRLSAWNSSAPSERMFIKFEIWGFVENLSR
jgi:hypothetical protein